MEQRRLRLGDILDDYCPRERRVTNHAVVAMIEDSVKQTRCTTCDAEHPYKGGQAPRRKKKEAAGALYKEVLAGKPETDASMTVAPSVVQPNRPAETIDEGLHEEEHEEKIVQAESVMIPRAASDVAPNANDNVNDVVSPGDRHEHEPEEDTVLPHAHDVEDGPVHRPLIRATLPRPEGQKDSRPLPDFTVRQSGGRGGNNAGNQQFRGGGGGGNNRMRSRSGGQGGNGHRPHGSRFTGARQGQGRGQGGGFRPPQQPRHGGGGRKRSR
jgi:hypothetical protein